MDENTEKYIKSSVPTERDITWNDKSGEEITKTYPKHYNSLIGQDL